MSCSNEAREARQQAIIAFFVFQEQKHKREIVLNYIKENGWALEYTLEESRADPEIVMAAVTQDRLAIKFANEKLKTDPKIVAAATIVRQPPGCLCNRKRKYTECSN